MLKRFYIIDVAGVMTGVAEAFISFYETILFIKFLGSRHIAECLKVTQIIVTLGERQSSLNQFVRDAGASCLRKAIHFLKLAGVIGAL